jgi:uncharacterized protein (DUF983 family)
MLRQRCPRCFAGKVYRGLLAMNETCPVCGLRFEREEGYFTGAMYISYLFSLVFVFAIFGVLWFVLPNDTLTDVGILCLVSGLLYLPLVPLAFRYSRVLYMHMDRKLDPDVDEIDLSEAGSPCRWTTLHSPSSRRNTVVARSTYGCGGAPLMDAVVRSKATVYARSPLAPAAMTSFSYDVQFEKDDPSRSNTGRISAHPAPLKAAPNSVTGSLCDHIPIRGPASPLCKAISTSFSRGMAAARNSSVSVVIFHLLTGHL